MTNELDVIAPLHSTRSLIPGTWVGNIHLPAIRELNEACIELLVPIATTQRPAIALPAVDANRHLWRSLDASARARVAQYRLLLIDIRQHNDQWWRWATTTSSLRQKSSTEIQAFPTKAGTDLLRETIRLAQQLVRAEPPAAALLMGISTPVAEIFAALSLRDIARIAAQHHACVRPRWADQPGFWRNLLLAAQRNDADSLCDSHLHGLQLLGGELLRQK